MFKQLSDPAFRSAPRLIYVRTADHGYTFRETAKLLQDRGVAAFGLDIERLLRRTTLPRATYILTDFDRLSPTEAEALSLVRKRMRAAGLTVLNDPGAFRPRDALIRVLHQAGINRYTCWRPAWDEMPDRYPVFLRSIAGHRGVISDLLHTPAEVRDAISSARGTGFALRDLVLIEYAAAPLPDTGIFQKHAAFRVGHQIIRANTVNDVNWVAKHGTANAATAEFYAAELTEADDYPHAKTLMRAFELAEVDFGRADFALVDGQPQIYEINTNPAMSLTLEHANADRVRTLTLLQNRLLEALAALASIPAGDDIDISDIGPRSSRIKGALRRL